MIILIFAFECYFMVFCVKCCILIRANYICILWHQKKKKKKYLLYILHIIMWDICCEDVCKIIYSMYIGLFGDKTNVYIILHKPI